MHAVINRIEQLVETLGSLARGCVLVLVLLVSANVLIRYGFSVSPVALQELEWFLISPIALLGISYVLKHRADVRVDFIYEKFQPRTQAAVDLFSALATCLIGAFLAVAVFAAAMKRGELPAQMRRCVRPYLPAGIVFAMAYFTLVLALEIGRVTIFAPLNAMQSMWTVVFAWFLLGKSDAIGVRIVVAMALVVSGGILIGDRKSTRLNSSHEWISRMPSSA